MCIRDRGEGNEPGRGGTGRGRGDAPLAFEMEERPRLDTVSRRVVHEDLSRAVLGEAAGVETAAPNDEVRNRRNFRILECVRIHKIKTQISED